eukprot:3393811-Rhodomonas_salina.1
MYSEREPATTAIESVTKTIAGASRTTLVLKTSVVKIDVIVTAELDGEAIGGAVVEYGVGPGVVDVDDDDAVTAALDVENDVVCAAVVGALGVDVGVVVALIELVEGAALLEVVWARLDELEAGSKRAATVVVVGVTVLVAVAVLVAREDDDVVLAAVVGARVDEIAPVVVDEMAVLGAGAVDALVACNVEDEESMEIVGVWVVAAVILIELVVLSALMIKASDEVDELEALGELAAAAVVLEAISVSAAVVVGDVLVAREVVDDDDGEEVGRTVVVDFMRPTEVDGARMEVVVLIGLVVCSALVVFRVVVGPTEVVNMVLVGCVVDAMMLVTSE